MRNWLQKTGKFPPKFTFKSVSQNKVRIALKRIKPSKTIPSDGIDGFLSRIISPLLLPAITHIVNLSLTQSIFADVWKENLKLPHHKKDDKNKIENYRPVSITVRLGLLTEIFAHEQVVEHFDANNLLHHNHHGSVACHDTSTAITQVNQFAVDAAEEKKITACLMIDQKAAFDLVDHEVLLGKLAEYGIDESAGAWFASYLKNRSYRVQVGAGISEKVYQGQYGVPQGSILGSTLFVIYENDLPDINSELDNKGQTVAYVDDTTDQVAEDDLNKLAENIQEQADRISEWLGHNQMVISPDKSKLLIMTTRQMRLAR